MHILNYLIALSLIDIIYSKSTSLTIIVNPLTTECLYENIQGLVQVELDYQVNCRHPVQPRFLKNRFVLNGFIYSGL